MSDVSFLITFGVAAGVLLLWFLKYKAGAPERRVMRMMLHYGLDPKIVAQGDTAAIIKEVRRRCGKCQFEGHCERWLDGKEAGDGRFCPNERVFEELERSGHA